ncbi:MAG: response regulator [Desulfobaccales bacterium]
MNQEAAAIIYLVDDDPDVRRSLERLFKSWGMMVQTFASPEEFLAADLADTPACLILDLKLPGMDGIALQERLTAIRQDIPIIFLTAYGTVPESVQAMKGGALEFLEKPVAEKTLMDAVIRALDSHRQRRRGKVALQAIEERLASLTPRERQILALIIQGRLNKQIAYELQIAEITVKIHRGRIMQKLQCSSLADLVLLAVKAGLHPPEDAPA